MNAILVYQEYRALKLHFTTDYDYFKYGGKLRVKNDPRGRKDWGFFERLSKDKEYPTLILSNILKNPKLWVGDLFNTECVETHNLWKRRNQGLTYQFKTDINKLPDDINEFLLSKNGHPELLRKYIAGEITLETLCILNNKIGFVNYWNSVMEGDPVWGATEGLMLKYTPFVHYDKGKIDKIFLDKFGPL